MNGATIYRLFAPDRDGKTADIVVGRDTLEEYMETPNCAGCFTGRERSSSRRRFTGFMQSKK